ncbi:proline dehydrogenase family protein [Taibaiella soli]|uniref:Proline dehydrogenase n=1 Tax=Taibaiella soli TaxID=1649169 RepID=A0A2W2AB15_9BACT|nr:proline dehydrogenase family protein [Taibaiella soli]PZF72481.1 proline dehydrogenase [Taibaiella soli]
MLPEFDNTEIAFQYRDNRDLKQAQFLFKSMGSPLLTKIGLTVTNWAINWNLPVKGLIKKTIFKQFCGGETMEEAAATANVLGKYGVGVILDYGVEGKEGEAEFDKAVPEFIRAIKYASSQKNIPFISIKITGFARFGLLEKIHAGSTLTAEEQAEWQRVRQRIYDICGAASRYRVMVLVDAEESWIQQPVDDLTDDMMEAFNKEEAYIFNTFQMYRHDRLVFLKQSFEKAQQRDYILGAKLVRGAYMEKERKRAAEMGYTSPIQPNKESTDNDYDEAVDFCLSHLSSDNIAVFIGTHNEKSCLKAAAYMEQHHISANTNKVYFSQLYGMSDNISFNLAHAGYHVAKYLPYGPVKDVIPYLMRRAQENTSVAGQTGRELSLINKEMKRRKL